jgi:hypothetical protein
LLERWRALTQRNAQKPLYARDAGVVLSPVSSKGKDGCARGYTPQKLIIPFRFLNLSVPLVSALRESEQNERVFILN